jgi:hypothetical protein
MQALPPRWAISDRPRAAAPAPELRSRSPGRRGHGLGGTPSPGFDRIRRSLILPIERGAETSLFCATQPVAKGAYIHNTLGEVTFGPDDPGGDDVSAARLWDLCEALCERTS